MQKRKYLAGRRPGPSARWGKPYTHDNRPRRQLPLHTARGGGAEEIASLQRELRRLWNALRAHGITPDDDNSENN